MDISRDFIVIYNKKSGKDEYKSNVESIHLNANGIYEVKYQNNPHTYHTKPDAIFWVRWKDAIKHEPSCIKASTTQTKLDNIQEIYSFRDKGKEHWRVIFADGSPRNYLQGEIQVIESCLADDMAKNSFEYLKQVARTNVIGKNENGEDKKNLKDQYDKIEFIDKSIAVSPYLNPAKYKIGKLSHGGLIFPFGCNASQEKAVTAAFEHQISVVQGPPGTGKTQTILNIIANILVQGKTVIVVSNNNSATENVKEKLDKYGFGFIVATLGKEDNKVAFLANQPDIPHELQNWTISKTDYLKKRRTVSTTQSKLHKVFKLQEELALLRQEDKAVELEWEHFTQDDNITPEAYQPKKGIAAIRYMKLWLRYQAYAEGDVIAPHSFFGTLKESIKWKWMNFVRTSLLGIKTPFDPSNIAPTIVELQALYYITRQREIKERIKEIGEELNGLDGKALSDNLCKTSCEILKGVLFEKYSKSERRKFIDDDLWKNTDEVCKQFPVVLSTTFSARSSLKNQTYDYLIMDEASQVSIETGALAMTCAKNAVIVGDTMQLPNIVTNEVKPELNGIFERFKLLPQGYNSAENSFLQSICSILPNVEQTLLREHYRCHPTIINFCNQKFYGGELIIMTEDNHEENVMMAIKTTPGHHNHDHYNQREIDVVKNEILPQLDNLDDVGIIAPYNNQVDQFNQQIHSIEAATIHKYQGREKDVIMMSTVDDKISEFSDDANLINVAISRAKNKFCLVTSGNEQERKGNIYDLLEYIAYNRLSVTESKIFSIFDYLYSNYTKERRDYLSDHKKISEYDSENLTFALLENILAEHSEYKHLGIICHMPLRNIIRDWSLLNDEEKKYIRHYSTHLDFLIINHVTKKPVLAIETDGFSYHNEETEQHHRDEKKNHILELYGLPLLRLSTIGSGEYNKIITALNGCLSA